MFCFLLVAAPTFFRVTFLLLLLFYKKSLYFLEFFLEFQVLHSLCLKVRQLIKHLLDSLLTIRLYCGVLEFYWQILNIDPCEYFLEFFHFTWEEKRQWYNFIQASFSFKPMDLCLLSWKSICISLVSWVWGTLAMLVIRVVKTCAPCMHLLLSADLFGKCKTVCEDSVSPFLVVQLSLQVSSPVRNSIKMAGYGLSFNFSLFTSCWL